jgi:hypothetical protein
LIHEFDPTNSTPIAIRIVANILIVVSVSPKINTAASATQIKLRASIGKI